MKKEYQNIFSKMIVHHNEEVVPFMKIINSKAFKISNNRILKKLELMEEKGGKYVRTNNFLWEYLLMNKFILEMLSVNERDNCLELLNKGAENQIIGAYALYSLIENKKIEILNKLKDEINIL